MTMPQTKKPDGRRNNRGKRPTRTTRAEWRRKGYDTGPAIAKRFNLSLVTVRSWVAKGWLQPVGDLPAVERTPNGNTWILVAAAEICKKRPRGGWRDGDVDQEEGG